MANLATVRRLAAPFIVLSFAFLLALPLQPAAADDDLQGYYDRGTAAASAGQHAEAVAIFSAGIEKLRAAGEGETPDAGLFAAGAARSLAALGDAQADEAYRLALVLLARSADAVPFVTVGRQFTERLIAGGSKGEAIHVAEAMLGRMRADGLPEPAKAAIIETAIGAYAAANREADADRVLAMAVDLAGTDPDVAYMRGMARMRVAREAQAAGRMVELASSLDGAIADMALAGEQGRSLRGVLLFMQAQMAMTDGEYRKALPAVEAAIPILESSSEEEESWVAAVAMRGRLLERLDRVSDAIAAVDEEIAVFEKRKGADSVLAVAARLDRIEFLVRAGRRDEARRALAAEAERRGNKADPVLAAYFFERLAAIDRADGRFRDAIDAAERAIALRREHQRDAPALLVEPMRIRAGAAEQTADYDFAEKAHREMVALAETVFPTNHPELARDLNAFAGLLASLRRFDEAEAIERRVAGILRFAYGENGAKYAYGLHNLGSFIMFNGKAEEAVALFAEAIAIADALPAQEDFRALARFSLGSALIQVGRYEDALAAADDAAARTRALPDIVANRLSAIAGVRMQALEQLGRRGEAIAAGREMVALGSGATREEAGNLAFGMTFLARVMSRGGAPDDALPVARKALSLTQSLMLGGAGVYRDASTAVVAAAWQVAERR